MRVVIGPDALLGRGRRVNAGVQHWEDWFAAGDGFLRPGAGEMSLLTRHLPPAAGARALDVGCGLGGYAAELAQVGYTTLAVDWAVSSVAAVRDRYEGLEPNLEARQVDFEDAKAVAELPRDSFDVVTMRLVYAFMNDRPAVAGRVRRLLRPGGVWVVTTPLANRLPADRAHIALAGQDIGGLLAGWDSGAWYDLEPGGLRCFILQK
ncbi:class I SAM-dependent methyltransferase [Streptomyces sp. NBC_01445]|uniref:class I SAM-dependent methyltransferase n=1 Tax=Streptomyces sp. NBC_01445 TaxID=2903869 RepID=UPI002DD80700|nr:class I SAM-dependent methyltransferase [Streptomyces sp. NBC_01445]WSE01965.1 class I SAM-dependent methyltransferase [Streptomyces sp. NBC_01445]WSE10366.1 class I SAM-dependent methyltransferase [Streptomyces sp. NBC_01445]WSE11068.1 class I SAM-dependent methyltransferase [Streptomyces sp. NBC_01445]